MQNSVIVNMFYKHKAVKFFILAVTIQMFVQFSNQPLNAQAEVNSIPQFSELLARPVSFRSELKGVHPRLFFTAADLPKMRQAGEKNADNLWADVIADIKRLELRAPDPRDEDLYKSGLDQRKFGSVSQYELAFQIAQTAFAYKIENQEKYFEAAKKWTFAACEMPVWGYAYNKPNVDLPPAHLLYAVSFAYDVLYDKLTKEERETIKNKLIKQARLMFDYFRYKPGKKYTYSQNHTWIPLAGLGIAAYALIDETEEAKEWAQLVRAVFDRTMLTFAPDGYFYEGFHYFGFAFRWVIRYFDVHLTATGENLYLKIQDKFSRFKYYAMHSILPDRENVFDFADVGDGALNRNDISKREKLFGESEILYRLASVYRDEEAQAIADFIGRETRLENREPMWAFINRDANLKAAPLSQIPLSVYFKDNDTVFWRSSWSKNATAFAFRCAPPEGHAAIELSAKIPDWRQNTGHAHPDASSFIIFANGKYLTGDTGYLGIKQTDDHNTILINNRGFAGEGVYEMFKTISSAKLNRLRVAEVSGNSEVFYLRGEAASAYEDDLKVKKFDRHFLYVAPDYFIVWDELETEKPAEFTFLLNADREIKLNGNEADLINQNALLRVVRILPEKANSKVVPQMVQARGLPGSVDKGEMEQRGVQLQTRSLEPLTSFEFLHFLQPVLTAEKRIQPKILPTTQGLKLVWDNGDQDLIVFREKEKYVERRKKEKAPLRMVFSAAK